MKITMIQTNPTIGDITVNTNHICTSIARHKDSSLLIYPELALQGYLAYDLFSYENEHQIQEAIDTITATLEPSQTAIIGMALPVSMIPNMDKPMSHMDKIPYNTDIIYTNLIYNCAVTITNKGIAHIQTKYLLPYYDVFLENRYFLTQDSHSLIIVQAPTTTRRIPYTKTKIHTRKTHKLPQIYINILMAIPPQI